MGVLSSNVASAVARFRAEYFARRKFQASMIQKLPVREMPTDVQGEIEALIGTHISSSRALFRGQEPLQEFCVPNEDDSIAQPTWDLMSLLGPSIEPKVAKAYGLTNKQYCELERDIVDALSVGKQADEFGTEEVDKGELMPHKWRRAETASGSGSRSSNCNRWRRRSGLTEFYGECLDCRLPEGHHWR